MEPVKKITIVTKDGKTYQRNPRGAGRDKENSNKWYREHRKNHPEYHAAIGRNRHLKAKYGITSTDYDRMHAAQGGVCKICGNHQRYQKLAVDHDHQTGALRGLLCVMCNRGIGMFFDSPLRLIRAAEYLRNAKAQSSQTRESAAST